MQALPMSLVVLHGPRGVVSRFVGLYPFWLDVCDLKKHVDVYGLVPAHRQIGEICRWVLFLERFLHTHSLVWKYFLNRQFF